MSSYHKGCALLLVLSCFNKNFSFHSNGIDLYNFPKYSDWCCSKIYFFFLSIYRDNHYFIKYKWRIKYFQQVLLFFVFFHILPTGNCPDYKNKLNVSWKLKNVKKMLTHCSISVSNWTLDTLNCCHRRYVTNGLPRHFQMIRNTIVVIVTTTFTIIFIIIRIR